MAWLAKDPERRSDTRQVVEGALSVVTVGVSYYAEEPPDEVWDDPSRGRIARYAWGPDYHDVMTPMVQDLSSFIRREAGDGTNARYYVDTGPVLERSVAADAGLGFIGKNSLLIHPSYGSYVLLGEIITNVELTHDEPARSEGAMLPLPDGREGTCGSCRRCLDVCPTHAFPAPYILDSRLCISYLTIELKGPIPEALRPLMKNWVFGCDECQTVCPWVKRYAKRREDSFLRFEPDECAPSLLALMDLDDARFRDRFRRTPVQRTKRRGLLRNAAVALGNWGDAAAKPVLERALRDSEPLVKEHVQWALDRI
jgi:epoxyqueuosine reductase